MNKPLLGLLAGGVLGVVDGLTALVSAPEVAPQIAMIVTGSMGKGLVAGVLIGWFAKKVNNLAYGVVFGLAMGALFALPFALGTNPETGKVYLWEILIPGSLVGLIVGYLTQRYGTASRAAKG
ncbi:MAG: hypothetical protein U0164_14865 [Gemmatimonadaceae bacterium]